MRFAAKSTGGFAGAGGFFSARRSAGARFGGALRGDDGCGAAALFGKLYGAARLRRPFHRGGMENPALLFPRSGPCVRSGLCLTGCGAYSVCVRGTGLFVFLFTFLLRGRIGAGRIFPAACALCCAVLDRSAVYAASRQRGMGGGVFARRPVAWRWKENEARGLRGPLLVPLWGNVCVFVSWRSVGAVACAVCSGAAAALIFSEKEGCLYGGGLSGAI